MALAAKEKPPEKMRPQEGDFLAFQKGDKKGEIIREEHVPMGGPVVMAFPMDPATGIIRKKITPQSSFTSSSRALVVI